METQVKKTSKIIVDSELYIDMTSSSSMSVTQPQPEQASQLPIPSLSNNVKSNPNKNNRARVAIRSQITGKEDELTKSKSERKSTVRERKITVSFPGTKQTEDGAKMVLYGNSWTRCQAKDMKDHLSIMENINLI